MQCGLSTTANIKNKLKLSNEILIQPLTSPTTALETCSFYERSHISSIFPELNSSLMSNNLQQTPVSNDIVAPIRGRMRGRGWNQLMLQNYLSRTVPSPTWRNQPQHNKVQGKPCVGKLQCCSRSLYEHLSNNSSLPAGHKSCEGSCYVVNALMDELGEL